MPEPPIYHAFTTQNSLLVNRLINDVTVSYAGKQQTINALWDTGATGTCISTAVAQALAMVPTGKMNINTPAGSKVVNTYLLDITLPNNVGVKDVQVCDSDIGNQGIDMLLGMDVILLGDFSVSSFGGKTTFTFRTPSKQKTDYVQQINIDNLIGKKHGKGKRKRR